MLLVHDDLSDMDVLNICFFFFCNHFYRKKFQTGMFARTQTVFSVWNDLVCVPIKINPLHDPRTEYPTLTLINTHSFVKGFFVAVNLYCYLIACIECIELLG